MGEVVCLSSYREQKLREEVDELAEYVDWLLEGIDKTPQPYYPWLWRLIEAEVASRTGTREEGIVLDAYDLAIQGYTVQNAVTQVLIKRRKSLNRL